LKKIDIHTHVLAFPEFCPPRPDGGKILSAQQQLEVHEKLNVDKAVLLPSGGMEGQWHLISTESCMYIASQHPEHFLWFCNVDPRAGNYNEKTDLGYLLNYYKERGAKGLGELMAPINADDPMMDNLFGFCEELELPVLIHIAPQHGDTYGIVDELGLPRIERMLKKHPDMKLIGHSAAFWSEISEGLTQEERNGYPTGKVREGRLPKLMREYGNLYCDLSAGSGSNAMMRDPEYAAKFMAEFADRIFYGADVCSTFNTFQYDFDAFLTKMVADGMLSQENYEKIIRKNAVKLLGLPE